MKDELHHKVMLQDKVRIEAYAKAIKELGDGSKNYVDIGSGSGILSLLCASRTSGTVTGIEYSKELADFSSKISLEMNFERLKFLNESSFNVKILNTDPFDIVTETIGQIGPEENIVELCYDFVARHPGQCNQIIPSSLKIFAQPLRYSGCAFQNDFLGVGVGELQQSEVLTVEAPQLLARYQLGLDYRSDFITELDFSLISSAFNAVHLYFSAEFSDTIELCTHFLSPMTHWNHALSIRPVNTDVAKISYVAGSGSVRVDWRKK